MVFFTELEQKCLQCEWEQKTPNSQAILRKKSKSWQNQVPWLQTILQAKVIKTLVLAQKQKYIDRLMEQDTKSTEKPMHL